MLVLIGAIPEGKKELVGFQGGVRERAQSWRGSLADDERKLLLRPCGTDRAGGAPARASMASPSAQRRSERWRFCSHGSRRTRISTGSSWGVRVIGSDTGTRYRITYRAAVNAPARSKPAAP
jgi:hypothetical protein